MPIKPTHNDVLLGRGGYNFANEGNNRLKDLAILRAREYGAASKKNKAVISRQVLQQVKEEGGRFLKKVNPQRDVWVEVNDVTAREKVCQVLRDQFAAIRHDDTSSSDTEEAEEEEDDDGEVEQQARERLLSNGLVPTDRPKPNLITSSIVSTRNNFEADADTDYCNDFDLFEDLS